MLNLIVPGLIWPRQALADLSFDLDLPALSTLLGQGRLSRLTATDVHDCAAAALGLETPLPAAALRRLAAGLPIDNADWLCLDPVSIRFEQQTPLLDDPCSLRLEDAETDALIAALAPIFDPFGQMVAVTPATWNLRLTSPAPAFRSLPASVLKSGPLLPREPAYASWRKACAEAETVLHIHPVNQARAATGLPIVSGVVPWGAGRLPSTQADVHNGRCAGIQADDPVLTGLARWLDVPAGPLPPRHEGSGSLVLLDPLDLPARRGDGAAWRETLLRLEDHWFAPALGDLRRGKLKGIRVDLPDTTDATGTISAQIRRADLWKFWRKPPAFDASLTPLLPP